MLFCFLEIQKEAETEDVHLGLVACWANHKLYTRSEFTTSNVSQAIPPNLLSISTLYPYLFPLLLAVYHGRCSTEEPAASWESLHISFQEHIAMGLGYLGSPGGDLGLDVLPLCASVTSTK